VHLRQVTIEQVEVELSPGFSDHGRGQMRGIANGEGLTIQGWVLGNSSLPLTVELSEGSGGTIVESPIDQPRDDIAEAFSDTPGASHCGFGVTLSPSGSGAGLVQVRVLFEDGSSAEFGTLGCEVDGGEMEAAAVEWSLATTNDESQKVLFGKEGWLFLRRDTNDILGQHTGRVTLEPEQRETWRRVLEARMGESDRLGATWFCVVAPDKESVYPEYLPEEIVPVARRPIHEFLDLAEEIGAPVSYPLDRLVGAKGEAELYPRTDTHWNYRGSYLAYREFCDDVLARGVDLDVIEEDDVAWVDDLTEGDLGGKIHPEPLVGPTIRPALRRNEARLVADNGVSNHGHVECFEKPGSGQRCVMFGESFALFLLPFLKETFQRLVFVHTSMFVSGILEHEQPDVVLSLPLERFLIRVPNDENALEELQATARRKGGDLPWPAPS
jgi:alginate O-acetyltransferase complex protein AlgJ